MSLQHKAISQAIQREVGAKTLRSVTGVLAFGSIGFSIVSDALPGGSPGFGTGQAIMLAFGIATLIVCFLPVEWIRRYLLVVCASAASAVFAEGVLRVVFVKEFASTLELDPRYLYKLTPNTQRVFTRLPINGGQTVRPQVNSEGFRGRELRGDASKRVIVYGDSFVHAEFSALDQTFVAKLEAMLQTQLPGVEVINAGVIGYGPDQSSLRMEDELPRLRPDVVILALYSNDFGDLLRNKLFKLDGRGRLVENTPHFGEALTAPFRLAESGLYLEKLLFRIRNRLHTRAAPTPDSDLMRCRNEYESYVENGDNEIEYPLDDHWDADLSLEPDGESARYKKHLMVELLRRVEGFTARQDARLVLLLIPAPIDVCDGYDGGQVDTTKYPAYQRTAMTDAMAEAAAQAGISYLNLFPVFRAQPDPNQLYFHGDDEHWNDAGQELAAREMAEYIRENGLLE